MWLEVREMYVGDVGKYELNFGVVSDRERGVFFYF